MSGPFDAFLSRCVSDCVNAETPMTAQQWAQQEERIDVEVEEYHELRGRFAFDAGDDPFPERSER